MWYGGLKSRAEGSRLRSEDCADVVCVVAKEDKVQKKEKLQTDVYPDIVSPVFNNRITVRLHFG